MEARYFNPQGYIDDLEIKLLAYEGGMLESMMGQQLAAAQERILALEQRILELEQALDRP